MNIIPANLSTEHRNSEHRNSEPGTIWAYTVTVSEDNGVFILYNWLNGEYAVIDDEFHPVYSYLTGLITSDELADLLKPEESNFFETRLFFNTSNIRINELADAEYTAQQELRPLHLILLPAEEACNFGCLYCYENPAKKRRMTEQHRAVLTEFVKNYKAGSVSVEYFGGEPLLNPGFILQFNNSISEYCASVDIPFFAGITTNGYLLTLDLFRQLYASGLHKYQITIDGNEEDHNVTRPLRGGGATYTTIFENLKALTALPASFNFSIDLRINFNEKTATPDKMEKFTRVLVEAFGDDMRFKVRFRPIGNYSAYNNKDNSGEANCSHKHTGTIKAEYEKLAHSSGFSLSDISMYCSAGKMQCYAGNKDSFIIGPDYSVYKCTIAFDDPVNLVGSITGEGKFEANENYSKWITPLQHKQECGSCFLSGLCGGRACPLENIKKEQVVCPPLKNNYSHTVKMIVEEAEMFAEQGE